MNNDLLKKWALVAEIIGGIAIVLSLLFVGFQIRQEAEQTRLNTRAVEASAYQDLIGQMNTINLALFTDDESMAVVIDALSSEKIVDPIQLAQAARFVGYVFRHSEMSHLQYEKGLITHEQLYSVLGPLNTVLESDYGMQQWQTDRLSSSFRDYVNENIFGTNP